MENDAAFLTFNGRDVAAVEFDRTGGRLYRAGYALE
jgi:hypothetical protein